MKYFEKRFCTFEAVVKACGLYCTYGGVLHGRSITTFCQIKMDTSLGNQNRPGVLQTLSCPVAYRSHTLWMSTDNWQADRKDHVQPRDQCRNHLRHIHTSHLKPRLSFGDNRRLKRLPRLEQLLLFLRPLLCLLKDPFPCHTIVQITLPRMLQNSELLRPLAIVAIIPACRESKLKPFLRATTLIVVISPDRDSCMIPSGPLTVSRGR